MQRDCQLMDNGDVYEILRDGTIHKVGNINNRVIYSNDDAMKGWLWGISIVCGIAIIALIIALVNVNNDLDYARSQWRHYSDLYDNEQSRNSTVVAENRKLKEIKSTVANNYPIIINNIEIGNVYKGGTIETNYGSTIYSYNTMFLQPKISYTGLRNGYCSLKVKFYNAYGVLSTGISSPSGYSYTCTESISEGNGVLYLSGWGGENRGNWTSGTYRIEIWYNNMCLKSKTFTIY